MKKKGPSWGDREGVEERKIERLMMGESEMGRSTAYVVCPFCSLETKVYLWSFAGCGKRCSCGALMGWSSGAAIHWKERADEA